MDDSTTEKEWRNFAKTIDGTIEKSDTNYFDRDNKFKISTKTSEIDLTWGNQPQRGRGPFVTLETNIRYTLNINYKIEFRVSPNDLFSKIFSSLSSKKQKFGIKELDQSYLLKCNTPNIAFELKEIFTEFHKFNKYKNFVIEIENISDSLTLTIFIPELITTQEKLSLYYNFGLELSKKISANT